MRTASTKKRIYKATLAPDFEIFALQHIREVQQDSNIRKASRPCGPIVSLVEIGVTERELHALHAMERLYTLPHASVSGQFDNGMPEFALRSFLRQEGLIDENPPKLSDLITDHPVDIIRRKKFQERSPSRDASRPDGDIDRALRIGLTEDEGAALGEIQERYELPRLINDRLPDRLYAAEFCIRQWLRNEGALDFEYVRD